MYEIGFIKPGKKHEKQVEAYIREHLEHNETDLHGGALIEKAGSYSDWLKQVRANSDRKTVKKDWVLSSSFFVVRKSDRVIIGMVDIRHELNDFLKLFGGNIGIGIRPGERGKGYGSQILELALEYCRKTGMKQVIMACYKDNLSSAGIIKKNGGILEREYLLSEIKDPPFELKANGNKTVQVYRKTF